MLRCPICDEPLSDAAVRYLATTNLIADQLATVRNAQHIELAAKLDCQHLVAERRPNPNYRPEMERRRG